MRVWCAYVFFLLDDINISNSNGTNSGLLTDAVLETLVASRSKQWWANYLALLAINIIIYFIWDYGTEYVRVECVVSV